MARRPIGPPLTAADGPIVVTGAASGMGRRLAQRWSAAGLTVVGVDRTETELRRLVAGGTLADAVVADVTDLASVRAAATSITERHGPIGSLVNAAGIIRPGRVGELPPQDFRDVIEVNYLGIVHWVDSVLPDMRRAGRGTIVNFASLAGWMPTPLTAAYTASKFAVVGYTEALASELRRTGIRVLAVCPPAVDTPMLAGIRDHPSMPRRITRLVPAIQPDTVIDSIEAGLARGRLFAFPGPGTASLYRLRRLSPAALRFMNRLVYGL